MHDGIFPFCTTNHEEYDVLPLRWTLVESDCNRYLRVPILRQSKTSEVRGATKAPKTDGHRSSVVRLLSFFQQVGPTT